MLKTIIIRNLFISITMWFVGFANIFAVPALPDLMEITQPNGVKFKAYLRGDEYFSWWESEKGEALFRNLDSGYFEYAKISMIDEKEELVPTGIMFVSGEEAPAAISSISNQDLGKIWMEKREQARKKLQEKLEKQKQSRNQ
ncbi:uncharacterized protein METZ01_LOCUS185259 [marine metagenome]|uniref:Uncharacterized protein n=1 Tax=marine metagenome TaxID=408172 RepID=A0A382D253_9ZZZZ